MSMLENLLKIETLGLETFIKNEIERWTCPDCGSIFCVHHHHCPSCKKEINIA
jgi:uncharacterized OB-fold protein